jgi:hypothetical protein
VNPFRCHQSATVTSATCECERPKMKSYTQDSRETEGTVGSQAAYTSSSAIQFPAVKVIRPSELPFEELIGPMSTRERFYFDLNLRFQVPGVAGRLQFVEMSGGDGLPKPQRDEVDRLKEALSSLLHSGSSIRATSGPLTTLEIARFGDVEINFRKMELRRGGNKVEVTPQEYKTLRYLVSYPEEAISREELLKRVWGYHNYPTTRTVDNRILKLRQKLERNPSKPAHLVTVRGFGYKFVP